MIDYLCLASFRLNGKKPISPLVINLICLDFLFVKAFVYEIMNALAFFSIFVTNYMR